MFLPIKDDVPHTKLPVITYALIAANVLMFVFFNGLTINPTTLPRGIDPATGFVVYLPRTLTATLYVMMFLQKNTVLHYPWALITHMFLHGGILHILFNMWALYLFGRSVEERFGSIKYLLMYLLAGVCGALTFMLLTPPGGPGMIGASGAVFGVMGMYLVLYPRARIYILMFLFIFLHVFTVPAVWFVGISLVFEVLQTIFHDPNSSVAHAAHVGGFLSGFALLLAARRLGWVKFEHRRMFDFLRPANIFARKTRSRYPNAPFPFRPVGQAVNPVEIIGGSPRVTGNNPEIIANLEAALLYLDDGDLPRAMALYLDCARTDPGCALPPEHQMRIARALESYHRYAEALIAFIGFLQAYPGHPYAPDCHLSAGELLALRLGRETEAVPHLKIAIKTHPTRDMRNKARGILALIRV